MYLPVDGRNEKKKCILMFLGIFPIECVKKKCLYVIFFGHFPVAGNKEKKRDEKKTKKKGA